MGFDEDSAHFQLGEAYKIANCPEERVEERFGVDEKQDLWQSYWFMLFGRPKRGPFYYGRSILFRRYSPAVFFCVSSLL